MVTEIILSVLKLSQVPRTLPVNLSTEPNSKSSYQFALSGFLKNSVLQFPLFEVKEAVMPQLQRSCLPDPVWISRIGKNGCVVVSNVGCSPVVVVSKVGCSPVSVVVEAAMVDFVVSTLEYVVVGVSGKAV